MAETSTARSGCDDETTSARSEYDVFLSFRGPDTRYGITDVLYEFMDNKGIRVFMDDESIRPGGEIEGELKRAINCSRVYVVVFSEDYVLSTWCLRELAMMVECRKKDPRKFILPIFYCVHPDVIKLKTGNYQDALNKHRSDKRWEGQVDSWKDALKIVGGISGREYKKDEHRHGKLAKIIYEEVQNMLEIRKRRMPHHLLQIEFDEVVDSIIKSMLECDPPKKRVVMLHGMGGIGKTTLANAIFNKIYCQFEGCSFFADVRATSTHGGGITKLQTKLLRDILGKKVKRVDDSSDGMDQIKRGLGGKRVLIIFDDVSEKQQLDELVGDCAFFGSGTRIIITTRDNRVCKGLLRPRFVYTYEMKEMSDNLALQLFQRHAFASEVSPNDFAALSEEVVGTSKNLPLALQVNGGHLVGESIEVWQHTLEKLKRVPHKDVLKILRTSYDGLEETEKQIFLDIACFPEDTMPRRYANYMWEACGFYLKCGVNVLLKKSLVKVPSDGDEIGKRSRIRVMGRQIAQSEELHHIGMHGRLWDPVIANNVVHQKKGTDKVLSINLELDDFSSDEFMGMSNLRFLGGKLNGEV